MPLITAIIPTFNREDTILTAVNSVLKQSYNKIELIVVDDGSTDNSFKKLKPLIENKKIKYIYQDNQGVSAARNTALKIAQGELIAFLDSDDFWLIKKCEKQVAFFNTHSHISICQTQEKWIRNKRLVNPRKIHLKKEGDIFFDSLKLCLISPSAVMIRKQIFASIGLFDTDLLAAEDYDLWLRICLKYKIGLINEELVVRMGGHADQLSAQVGLDKYRIWSLLKILLEHNLSELQKKALLDTLKDKAKIYGKGALKHKRPQEAKLYLSLAEKILQNKIIDKNDLLALKKINP